MTFVRPIALAACIAISTASALAFAQQPPSDTTSPSQANPPSSTTAPQSPQSNSSPSYGSMDTQNLTATQKQALKTCMDTEKSKNDGSTKDQMKQTCMTRLSQSPQG